MQDEYDRIQRYPWASTVYGTLIGETLLGYLWLDYWFELPLPPEAKEELFRLAYSRPTLFRPIP